MKLSLKLLKELTSITQSPEEIIQAIKEHIGEVEDAHNLQEDYDNIVVAEIKEKKEHPDADKLGIYQLSIGEEENIQVLAGDKTLEVGDKVAYFKPGAKIPYTIYTEEKPEIIQTVKMRGILSNGMMGSEKELNLGPDHTKVMRLSQDAKVGQTFSEYYQLDDFIIDIENKALTNRGDLFGIIGLARELTAIFGQKFQTPDWYLDFTKTLKAENNCLALEIINDAEVLCPRYTAIALDNIHIQESPTWLKSALIRFGYKPINNVVDITNYISHLVGQPLHAFDYDKVLSNDPSHDEKANINIRMARSGESILGLDNKVHDLNDRVVVIADSTNPIAIAGIIGGMETEVDQNTQRIILECANFDKSNIRKSSMALGINTDAATKFKHAITPEQCIAVLKKTVALMKELADAKVASEIIDVYNAPESTKLITFSINKLNAHLGTTLSKETILRILTNLDYHIEKEEEDLITVRVPFWRKDINIKEDIHEDIGRIYGFNNIEPILPQKSLKPAGTNKLFTMKQNIRNILKDYGLNEVDTYSFIDPILFDESNLDKDLAFKLKNPQAPELSLMRTSLIPSLLSKTQSNLQKGFDKFGLFEFNIPHIKGYMGEDGLPKEDWHLSVVLTNNTKDKLGSSYYLVKHYLDKVLKNFNIEAEYTLLADLNPSELPIDIRNTMFLFDINTSALVKSSNNVLGIIGEINNKIKKNLTLPNYTAAIDINVGQLIDTKNKIKKYIEMPKYPESKIDICIEINENEKYSELEKELLQAVNNDELWGKVNCLDIYKNDSMENIKRITFRLTIRNYNKTLKDKDIEAITQKISKRLINKYNAKLV